MREQMRILFLNGGDPRKKFLRWLDTQRKHKSREEGW